MQLDSDPTTVEWNLYNSSDNNNVIINANRYGGSCSTKRNNVTIPDGCFTLSFNDADDDGICCDYGYGRYEVKLNDTYLTFATLQTLEGDTTQIYFCTRLFKNITANSSKILKLTSNDNSKIVIKNNNNATLYRSDDFIPFGDAYNFLLPVDQIYQILIYKKSDNKWKEIRRLSSTDDWDVQLSSYVKGVFLVAGFLVLHDLAISCVAFFQCRFFICHQHNHYFNHHDKYTSNNPEQCIGIESI